MYNFPLNDDTEPNKKLKLTLKWSDWKPKFIFLELQIHPIPQGTVYIPYKHQNDKKILRMNKN